MASNLLPFRFENTILPIGDIPELHDNLQSARKKYRLHPLAQPSPSDIHLPHFIDMLNVFPIYVHRNRNNYRCVGNVRAWELCRAWLTPDQKVPVSLIHGRFKSEYWSRNYLLETYYSNVIYGLPAEDSISLHSILSEWSSDLELPNPFPSKAAYRRTMRFGKGRATHG